MVDCGQIFWNSNYSLFFGFGAIEGSGVLCDAHDQVTVPGFSNFLSMEPVPGVCTEGVHTGQKVNLKSTY